MRAETVEAVNGELLRRVRERDFQQQIMALAQNLGWLAFHDHDSRRNKAGFPDTVLVRERVIWAELKTERGRVRPEQRVWMEALRAAGEEVYLWRPSQMDQIIEILTDRGDRGTSK